jgi:putative flippase GtrA
MGDLSPRPSYTPRRTREQRAYRLAVVGGVAGAVAVVGFVLAIAGVIGAGIPLIAAIVAVVAALWFRRTVSPRG